MEIIICGRIAFIEPTMSGWCASVVGVGHFKALTLSTLIALIKSTLSRL